MFTERPDHPDIVAHPDAIESVHEGQSDGQPTTFFLNHDGSLMLSQKNGGPFPESIISLDRETVATLLNLLTESRK